MQRTLVALELLSSWSMDTPFLLKRTYVSNMRQVSCRVYCVHVPAGDVLELVVRLARV